jgi:pimeloyl-ACP methyl ester carboxylesterase
MDVETNGGQKGQESKVMLIHGLFMTPASWRDFGQRLSRLGYEVSAPGWPGHEGDIDMVRQSAETALAGLGLAEIIARFEKLLEKEEEQPVLIGHSFGGLIVQVLLDRGFGAAGVGVDPAAPKGVHRIPFAQLKSLFPVISRPGNRRKAVDLTLKQYQYAFANTMTDAEAEEVYERYAIPDTGRPLFQAALADLMSRPPSAIDYKNSKRAPLLLIAGAEDHIVPATVVRSNYRKYKSSAVTDFKEFPGRSHLIYVEKGLDEVVDYIDGWLTRTLPATAMTA